MTGKATKRKLLFKIDNEQDVDHYLDLLETDYNTCPLFYVSNVTGEGILNLSRGFFYNGSQSVLASLWNVNEKSGNAIIFQPGLSWRRGRVKW